MITLNTLQLNNTLTKIRSFKLLLSILLLTSIIKLFSCQGQLPSSGIIRNANTGLSTIYKNLKPENAILIMNDEVLSHTDIPLGEAFYIVNEGIKGFAIKDGNISVGCSLTIKDKTGKILLGEADLYKGNDLYNADNTKFLRCMVSNGSPMIWEEHYDVNVVFWDKYGTGKIENNVTIRCIDLP